MTEAENQELKNYKKCVQKIIDLLWKESEAELNTSRLSLASQIIQIIKSEEFDNIYDNHQPWNYRKAFELGRKGGKNSVPWDLKEREK